MQQSWWRRVMRTRTGFVAVTGLGTVAGLLLHNKLRLVADIPRAVYAEPDQASPAPADDALNEPDAAMPASGSFDGSAQESTVAREDESAG